MRLTPRLIFELVLLGLIIILLAILIFRKPDKPVMVSDREKALVDSLNLMRKERDSSRARQVSIQHSYDSLLAIDPQVEYKTREKIKFIFNTASPRELDSIIRTNWKTGSGHN